MKNPISVKTLIDRLKQIYPEVYCALEYSAPHELMIATRLSAQCTDKRVNLVTKELFRKYKSVGDFADADISEVTELIRACGLGNTKARDIVSACEKLRREFGGTIPDSMDGLLSLPGVGRKSANLLLGELYQKPAVVTDTHVIRLSNRLGLAETTDPKKVEDILRELIPAKESLAFCHRLVFHGRSVCTARNPRCEFCTLNDICKAPLLNYK